MKNPDLCQRPYCRERWTYTVLGFNENWKRGWALNVCEEHAKPYQGEREYHHTVWVTVHPRKQ